MKKLGLFTLILFGSIALNAQTVSNADAATLSKIKQANEKIITITSSFNQTKNMPVLGEKILSKGSFCYNKPEQLVMKYEDPKGDLMLFNDNKAIMVAAGKKREVSTKSNAKMRGMKNILASFIQGDMMQLEANKITCQETAKYIVVTAEMSKGNKNNISKVIASYDKSDLTISVIRTEDTDGTSIEYELAGKQLNSPIDQSVFNAPKK